MIGSPASQDDKNVAVLTHLSGMFFSFLVPLIVWLVSRDSKPWLAQEAKEALNFQLSIVIASVISGVLTVLVIGAFLLPAVWLANVIFCIVAAVKTAQGERYSYPLTLRLLA